MSDNRVQYAERSWEQNGGVRRIQDTRRPQEHRVQNTGTTHGRGSRAGSERKWLLRQQQQMQQQQKVLKRRTWILSFLLCVTLVLNVAAVGSMYFRMQRMDKALEFLESRIPVGNPEGVIGLQGGADEMQGGAGGETGSAPDFPVQGNPTASDPAPRRAEQDYVSLCGLDSVDRPRERTPEQVMKCLDQLAEEDERIAGILENSYKYPDKLLEALANNPEMTDFVAGYEDNAGKVSGFLTEDEKKQDFPLFLQWDPRWGYGDYGDASNIALAGCGPTCLSMALFYLTRDESLTPDKMAEYSMENGYYMSGTGTAWALLEDVPEKYGIYVSQPKAEEHTMKTALDNGSVIICSMGPGDFTAAGHFIVIYGYDKTGFYVNDPNCVARSRQTWSFSELKGQIKNIWVMGGSVKSDGVMYKDVDVTEAAG